MQENKKYERKGPAGKPVDKKYIAAGKTGINAFFDMIFFITMLFSPNGLHWIFVAI